MAGFPKASQKKQAPLTSFFKPKAPSNGPSQEPRPSSPSSGKEAGEPTVSTRKRPLHEENGGDGGEGRNDTLQRQAKRVKPGHGKEDGEEDGEDASNSTKKSGSKHGFRTERYVYDASQAKSDEVSGETGVDGDIDIGVRRQQQELHKKFVQKLGGQDGLWRKRMVEAPALEGQLDEGDGDEDGSEDAVDVEPPPTSKGKRKGGKSGKLTPMELQFLEIKRKHLDTILIFEVGYKFQFFGEDARIAAKELTIMCMPGKLRYDEDHSEAHLSRFASASIPVHRLAVHVKRLVAAGYKVGVVRQIETKALKKAGDNRNAPFVRKLTSLYTKGTYIDEAEMAQAGDREASSGGYVLCITESVPRGAGTDEKVEIGIIAVQPATGDMIYDHFEDDFMRREAETRLLHIAPCEFLVVGELSKATSKLIEHLSGSRTNVLGDRSRVEQMAGSKTMAAEAVSNVTQFYAGKVKEDDEQSASLLEKVLNLAEPVTICLSAMIKHLTEYGLEHIFDLTKYFQPFATRQHMLINGTTLESLEIYRNATDHAEKGSLFWAVDKTQTRFGRRLLRKWIGRPLLDRERLEERVAAVDELLASRADPKVERLKGTLGSIKSDLERSLVRIFYRRCTRPELLSTLETLQKISMEYGRVKSRDETGFRSRLLGEAICSLPPIGRVASSCLNRINPTAAARDDKYAFFREEEENDEITNHKLGIAAVEQDLDAHRREAAAALKKKTPISYVTVAGIEYLIEVTNADCKHVPASWLKVSGTKKLSRYHTPDVVRLLDERDQHKEALAAACDTAFTQLLDSIAAEYRTVRDAVSSLATLDCLLSLAELASLPGYSKPTYLPTHSPSTVNITDGRNPIGELTLPNGYIPFSTSLSSPAPLAHLITGPNMGGKSSYVRAVALLVLLAQVGSFVPAAAMQLTLCDAIHTRIGARDNLFAGESTFMVEVSETAAILRAATPRSLVVLDELGRGTSTHDGAAIAQAVLDYVVRETRCLTLFITHYHSLARVADGLGPGLVRCVHMRFTAVESTDGEEEITFLYEVGDGIAHRSYGLNVARLARIPRTVLQVAAEKSREMEEDARVRQLNGAMKLLARLLEDEDEAQLDQLVSGIEQL